MRSALLLVAILLFTSPAAATDLGCALSAQGALVRWDSRWQADGEDADVPYRIQRIVDNKSSVFVELSTSQSAVKPLRFFTVDRKHLFSFCDRVFPKQLTRSSEITTLRAGPPARVPSLTGRPNPNGATAKLPFIRYTPKGWVRSDPPENRQLTICEVHNRRFSCLPEEQTEFASALRDTELELSNTPK